MREAIGGTWLLGLVLTFIVFFTSFLAISINYSKAFNVKNTVVDMISKYEGNNCNARKNINNYLNNTGYLVPGTCDYSDGYVGYDLSGNIIKKGQAYYCIKNETTGTNTTLEKKFYRVMVFFKIDLPMVGELTTFRIKGETESIYFAKDEEKKSCE